MSDDAFAELERQLAEIASFGTMKAVPQATSSVNKPTNQLPVASNSQGLQQEVGKWKKLYDEANQRAESHQIKLQEMVEAVKEERELQKQNEEELGRRAEAAEARAEAVEEKLIKLVEVVKKDRAARSAETPAVNQTQIAELTKKNTELQQEIQNLNVQIGTLEGELLNKEASASQDRERAAQLQKEVEQCQKELQNSKQTSTTLTQAVQQLQTQIQQLQATEGQLKRQLQEAQSQHSQSGSNKTDLEERLEKAEATSREYEAKINKLVTAVKTERGALKQKVDDAEAKAQAESTKVASLQAKIAQLESSRDQTESNTSHTRIIEELQNRIAQLEEERNNLMNNSSAPPPPESPVIEDAPPGGGPPPPPPPAPALKVIDSSKITLKKGAIKPVEEKPKDAKAESMTNLIAEIRGGVKLKAVTRTTQPASPKSEGVDLGALAAEIAKNRQKRMVNKPPNPNRKSAALTNLLKELDGLYDK